MVKPLCVNIYTLDSILNFFLFGSLQVAEIAAGAMNDYLLMEHMLKVHVIAPEHVKPNL